MVSEHFIKFGWIGNTVVLLLSNVGENLGEMVEQSCKI